MIIVFRSVDQDVAVGIDGHEVVLLVGGKQLLYGPIDACHLGQALQDASRVVAAKNAKRRRSEP